MTIETLNIIHNLLVKQLSKLETKVLLAKMERDNAHKDEVNGEISAEEVEVAEERVRRLNRKRSAINDALLEFESHEWR